MEASDSTQVQPSGSQPLETRKIRRKTEANPSLGEDSIPHSLHEDKSCNITCSLVLTHETKTEGLLKKSPMILALLYWHHALLSIFFPVFSFLIFL